MSSLRSNRLNEMLTIVPILRLLIPLVRVRLYSDPLVASRRVSCFASRVGSRTVSSNVRIINPSSKSIVKFKSWGLIVSSVYLNTCNALFGDTSISSFLPRSLSASLSTAIKESDLLVRRPSTALIPLLSCSEN